MLRAVLVSALLATACSKSEAPSPASGSASGSAPATAPATATPATPPAAPSNAGKDPARARTLIAEGAVVIDVRTAEEFAEGHLPSARNLPVQQFPGAIAQIDELVGGDKAKAVVVHCASGARSRKAKQQLEAAGYSNVVNGGGYDDLK